MKSGYKIFWTAHALDELAATIAYLEINFPDKTLQRLAQKIESITELTAFNPQLFAKSDQTGIYKVSVLKFNTMYYRVQDDTVEILSFFSNRQNPGKRENK